MDADRLVVNRGSILCPHREGARACQSGALEIEIITPHLTPECNARMIQGLQHMLAVQLAVQEAAARLEEERRRQQEAAARLAREEKVRAYRRAIVEDYLVLRCPRCQCAWYDYTGCDALTCANCGAGFCALCLKGRPCRWRMIMMMMVVVVVVVAVGVAVGEGGWSSRGSMIDAVL